MKSVTKSRFIAIAASLAVMAPVAAFAADAETVVEGNRTARSATVSFADLNLGSSDGLETLRGRVYRVAKSLCIETGSRDLQTFMLGQTCLKTAIADTEPQIARAADAFRNQQASANTSLTVRRRS